ncbi:MAG: tetratricopeptide repeat protein, partial [Alphaproteobacteria bacterium]|nr:tetratricopeptide repeat protein [Alphaproteobacteria bacterium]
MPTVADILQFGLAAHRAGKSDVAERAYRQILEFDRDQTDALHLMAVLDCQRGRFAQAIDGIARAMALRADQPGYRLTYADALVGVGRLDQAVAIYRDILSAADDVAEAHAGLAGALQRLGRFDDAVRHYRRVVALGALDADRLENFGIAAISSGDFAAAADALWRAVALAPERAVVQMHLGLAMQWLRRKPDAYQRYRMAL